MNMAPQTITPSQIRPEQPRTIPKRINPVAAVNLVPPSQRNVPTHQQVSERQINTRELVSPPKGKISFNITPVAYGQSPTNNNTVLTNRVNSPFPPLSTTPQQKAGPQLHFGSSFANPYPVNNKPQTFAP